MLIVEVVSQPVVLLVKVFSTLVLLFGVVFIAGATNVSLEELGQLPEDQAREKVPVPVGENAI